MKQFLALRLRRTFHSLWFAAALSSAFLLSAATVFFIQNIIDTFSDTTLSLLETFRQGSSYDLLMLKVSSAEMILHPEWGTLIRCILGSSTMAVLLAAAVSQNMTEMFQHGGFFRAAAKGISRSGMYLSGMICAVLLTVSLSAAYAAGFALTAIVSGMESGTAAFSETFRILFAQGVMLSGFAVICAAVSVILRHPIAAILTNISVAVGIPMIFLYLRIVFRIPIDSDKFWMLSRLGTLTGRTPAAADYLSALIPAAAAFLCGWLILDHIKLKHE